MKKYMAVFFGNEEGMKRWGAFDEKTRKDREQKGISNTKNELSAYTVVQAESHEEAAKIFLNHPHFTIFPGDRIEVMECLPIPGSLS